MSDQSDDSVNQVLLALAGIIALVLAGVLTVAIVTGTRHARPGVSTAVASPPPSVSSSVLPSISPASRATAASPTDAATSETRSQPINIDFAATTDALPASASVALAQVADAARIGTGATVVVSGESTLAMVVRHALEADGVSRERVSFDLPDAEVSRRRVRVWLR